MLLVGLTGGLGAGKSTVARMMAERGAIVIDADDLARRAVEPGTRAHDRIVEAFGEDVVSSGGRLDRRRLADVVFADEEKRRALESIVHPEVFRLLGEEVARYRETDHVVVFDAPLIVETGFDAACDVVVVVSAPSEVQVARARERGISEEEAGARIAAQATPRQRSERADVEIDNAGGLEMLARQVEALWARLRDRAAQA